MEPEEKQPTAIHWMASDTMIRLIPIGSGYWRFTEDKAGVMEISWVQRDLEILARLSAEDRKVFSLKLQGTE